MGALETYLNNRDAQDMLDTLKLIVTYYSKYINVQILFIKKKNYFKIDSIES